jgi:crotonobetainyl-CoA:carnitine CoA-transferase CaiB-like acyl-CoA transferase
VLIYFSDVAGRQPALDQGSLCGLGQAGVALHHAVASDLKLPGNADGYLATHITGAPLLGEHSAQVLTELGYTATQITDMAAAQIIRTE